MPLTVHQFPCLSDNYGFLAHDEATGKTACIDTPEVAPILAALKAKGWTLDLNGPQETKMPATPTPPRS